MTLFLRWQEMLVTSMAPDLWDLSFSQSSGYLGTDQGVSGRVGKWIYMVGSVSTACSVAAPQAKPGQRH